MMRTPNILATTFGFIALTGFTSAHALSAATSVTFDNTSEVITDVEGGTNTSKSNVTMGASQVGQFSSSTGVLTGATVKLTSTRTQTSTTTSSAGGGTGVNTSVMSIGKGSSNASISAPGAAATFSSISATDNCSGHKKNACNDGSTVSDKKPTNASIAVDQKQLNQYVGNGNVVINREAPSITAELNPAAFTGSEQVSTSVEWKGNVDVQYDYLLHADPLINESTSPLAIDFGSVYAGDSIASILFNIGNGEGDRTGLDLDSISSTGDAGVFQTDLSLFTNLAAGGSKEFFVSFNTSAVGVYIAKYVLNFSDADIGASSTWFGYTREIDIYGTVMERPVQSLAALAAVPEPGSIALLLSGVMGFCFSRRKNQSHYALNLCLRPIQHCKSIITLTLMKARHRPGK